jgi:hypothetical protein
MEPSGNRHPAGSIDAVQIASRSGLSETMVPDSDVVSIDVGGIRICHLILPTPEQAEKLLVIVISTPPKRHIADRLPPETGGASVEELGGNGQAPDSATQSAISVRTRPTTPWVVGFLFACGQCLRSGQSSAA